MRILSVLQCLMRPEPTKLLALMALLARVWRPARLGLLSLVSHLSQRLPASKGPFADAHIFALCKVGYSPLYGEQTV
jgi:hypothetical protein